MSETPLHEYIDTEAYDVVVGEHHRAAMDCMNYAWTIICNVSEGDWTKQTQEWQDAAARCRDQYHALLGV